MRKEMESVLEMEKMIASSPHNTATRGNRGPRAAGATPASGRKSKKVSADVSVSALSSCLGGRMTGKIMGVPPRSEAERCRSAPHRKRCRSLQRHLACAQSCSCLWRSGIVTTCWQDSHAEEEEDDDDEPDEKRARRGGSKKADETPKPKARGGGRRRG